jgi:hypothetical protein
MPWIPLRSKRDPAFWVPLVLALLFVLVLGIGAQRWATGHLLDLQAAAERDPRSAAAGAERTLRNLSWTVGGFCLLNAVLLARHCQLGLRQGRLPPRGWWSLGAHRMAVGPTADRLGRVGLLLALVLGLVGIVIMFLFDRLIDSLVAGRVFA